MSQTVYLIDTNAFLHPSKQYYQFNFAPSFWQQLNEHFISGRVITLDKVWDEICVADEEEKKDDIQNWLESQPISIKTKTNTMSILNKYSDVLNHLQSSEKYTDDALREWSDVKIADPWLIATALEKNYTIVSFEKKINYQPKQIMKRAKIPNVCEDLSVSYCDLFDMMNDLKFVL